MENNKKHVLIVDDDVSIGEMLQTILEFSGYKAEVVNNPQRIDEKVENSQIDIIILDMRLSGVSGTDVCTSLKNQENTKEIPILMMSALSNADRICKEAGADGFIYKPFEMDDLLAKVNLVLAAEPS